MTRCGCCEGWIIIVNNHRFLADSIPNAKVIFGSVENKFYPIPVYISYKPKNIVLIELLLPASKKEINCAQQVGIGHCLPYRENLLTKEDR